MQHTVEKLGSLRVAVPSPWGQMGGYNLHVTPVEKNSSRLKSFWPKEQIDLDNIYFTPVNLFITCLEHIMQAIRKVVVYFRTGWYYTPTFSLRVAVPSPRGHDSSVICSAKQFGISILDLIHDPIRAPVHGPVHGLAIRGLFCASVRGPVRGQVRGQVRDPILDPIQVLSMAQVTSGIFHVYQETW